MAAEAEEAARARKKTACFIMVVLFSSLCSRFGRWLFFLCGGGGSWIFTDSTRLSIWKVKAHTASVAAVFRGVPYLPKTIVRLLSHVSHISRSKSASPPLPLPETSQACTPSPFMNILKRTLPSSFSEESICNVTCGMAANAESAYRY